jgi:environmental stress-induced protein Ves
MRITPIPPHLQALQPWRNGAGSTREIVRVGPQEDFLWRASIARVDASGPFSAFPGHRRWSCLLDGGPLQLLFSDGARLPLEPRMRAHAYAGHPAPMGVLDGEFAIVFNVMAARNGLEVQVFPRPLVGSMLLFDQIDTDWLVYLISGEATLRLHEQRHGLGEQHALLLHGEGDGSRAVLEGGGEVMLVKIGRIGSNRASSG